mmetsp:Transcript_44144/g.172128  ORF Transcript_44144/g.172128 Transcript_44144/m.172128 type:complete len:120 (+) Transcript_44144:1068-1427(+)
METPTALKFRKFDIAEMERPRLCKPAFLVARILCMFSGSRPFRCRSSYTWLGLLNFVQDFLRCGVDGALGPRLGDLEQNMDEVDNIPGRTQLLREDAQIRHFPGAEQLFEYFNCELTRT